MTRNHTMSLLAASGAVALIASMASGDFFSASGAGTYTVVSQVGSIVTADLAETLTPIDGPFSFLSLAGTAMSDVSFNPAAISATVTLTDTFNDQIVIGLVGEAVGLGEPIQSASGAWTMISGTGQFAGWSGGGIWSTELSFNAGFTQATTISAFEGTLVPGPGAVAILGLAGMMGMVRRRR